MPQGGRLSLSAQFAGFFGECSHIDVQNAICGPFDVDICTLAGFRRD